MRIKKIGANTYSLSEEYIERGEDVYLVNRLISYGSVIACLSHKLDSKLKVIRTRIFVDEVFWSSCRTSRNHICSFLELDKEEIEKVSNFCILNEKGKATPIDIRGR
jgi:predicted metal-binding protein